MEVFMTMTKVFKSGNSQAVRVPKEFHLNSDRVEIFKRNNDLVIRELPQNLSSAFVLLTKLPDDFFADGRQDLPPEERDSF
jgi:antitoxin VapB